MNYKSKQWKRIRESALRRDGYMCQVSLRYGKTVEANTVHHILPAHKFPEFQFESWNLISVSAGIHNKLHIRDTEELSELGKDLARRTIRKYNIDVDLNRL